MLTEYLRAALRRARYEILGDEPGYYGEIRELPGVWASAETLESCREELAAVLEDWVLVRVARGLDIPALDGVEIRKVEAV